MAADMRLFDILGPIMIGPSSSHTAGAARIGRIVRHLLGKPICKAQVLLCGSFAATYSGHGTDRAIAGGLLDMNVDDQRLRESLSIAQTQGVAITFSTGEIRNAHPNTARITAAAADGDSICVQASSIGGGRILVNEIDSLPLTFSGEKNTYIVWHLDAPGAVAHVASLLADRHINIASMRLSRLSPGGQAVMVIEVDENAPEDVSSKIQALSGIHRTVYLEKMD